MALKGIRVIEMAGLAPVPFCGMILADFGASVIRVDRAVGALDTDSLSRGKRSIAVNLKEPEGQNVVRKLAASADILIEPFRPGVMEKMNLGPQKLMEDNPWLIYARLSGYGQTGPYAKKAGHDINFLGMSGVLSMLGRKNEKPTPPVNLLGDFAGGGLLCALGIMMCLHERNSSGKGQVIDCSMTEGAAYVSSFLFKAQKLPIFGNPKGENWLDTGAHFYDTYETSDGRYMAVGSIEPQFYDALMTGLEMSIDQSEDFSIAKEKISERFRTKTQAEWIKIFDSLDACVTPVLDRLESPLHELSIARNSFSTEEDEFPEPQPAPKFSRISPIPVNHRKNPEIGEHTVQILEEAGFSSVAINQLLSNGIVQASETKSKL